jgi:hypothetical protein
MPYKPIAEIHCSAALRSPEEDVSQRASKAALSHLKLNRARGPC